MSTNHLDLARIEPDMLEDYTKSERDFITINNLRVDLAEARQVAEQYLDVIQGRTNQYVDEVPWPVNQHAIPRQAPECFNCPKPAGWDDDFCSHDCYLAQFPKATK